jgi:cytidine deaminase
LDFFPQNNENNFYYQPIQYFTQELPDDIQNMMEQAVAVRKKSIHPIQKRVGAALLLDNGQTVLGSNQENAAYPSGLCAERVSIFGAIYPEAKILKWLLPQLPTPIKQSPIPPCGSCRQSIAEYETRQETQ